MPAGLKMCSAMRSSYFSPVTFSIRYAGDGVTGIRIRHARAGPPAHHARRGIDLQHLLERQVRRAGTLYISLKCMSSKPAVCCSRWITRTGCGRLPRVVDVELRRDFRAPARSRSMSSSRYICTSADAMKVLLIEPARKCVSAVTGVLAVAIGEADAAGPFDARRAHQRDAGAGNAGVAQDRLHGAAKFFDASSETDPVVARAACLMRRSPARRRGRAC